MRTIVHVTHEAVQKVGGIGTVLDGLLTSEAYHEKIERNILVSPLFSRRGTIDDRLGPGSQVFYSSVDGKLDHPLGHLFEEVQSRFHVDIVYGCRRLVNKQTGITAEPEVILIDITRVAPEQINEFKHQLYERFQIESARYEDQWEYDQYVKLAPPAIAVLQAIGLGVPQNECAIFSHEFMGMPTALAVKLTHNPHFHSVFYAHEVAPIRKLVEEHPGHDTMFYNVLEAARSDGKYMEDVFGPQRGYFKYALIEAARHCDAILSVGHYCVKELQFLSSGFDDTDIALAYNGIPAQEQSPATLHASKEQLRQYAHNLLGYAPNYVFTHVARTARSKGLWRDLLVLETIEKQFRHDGRTAVLFVLSTDQPARSPEDVRQMEHWWHWPVAHREGPPDLSGGEAVYYAGVQAFNARSRNVKVVYINQFGFLPELCGRRMPSDIVFDDLRRGSDLEFGQSIYEPFGIAQLEALSSGAICVLSSVCGCAGFVEEVTGGQPSPNIIIADYMRTERADDIAQMLGINRFQRDEIEAHVAHQIALDILDRLPPDGCKTEQMIRTGHALARQMSWEVVARDHVLPVIDRVFQKSPQTVTI